MEKLDEKNIYFIYSQKGKKTNIKNIEAKKILLFYKIISLYNFTLLLLTFK